MGVTQGKMSSPLMSLYLFFSPLLQKCFHIIYLCVIYLLVPKDLKHGNRKAGTQQDCEDPAVTSKYEQLHCTVQYVAVMAARRVSVRDVMSIGASIRSCSSDLHRE